MPKKVVIDLSGKKIGKLTVIKRIDTNKYNVPIWLCICDCGAEVTRTRGALRKSELSGIEKCMCKNCKGSEFSGTHLMSKSSEYNSWSNAIQRCTNSKNPKYHDYGGRGITVCERWINSFENLLADMGPRPSPKHSLDRIDVNGNYEPSNCRWATQLIQSRNTRVFSTNSSGVNGVKYRPIKNKRWVARIRHNGKDKFLGIFMTKEEAIEARKNAEIKYWGNNDKS